MHSDELQNWQIIKEKFEENETTDNFFYTRACAIVSGLPDPMDNIRNVTQDGWNQTYIPHNEGGVSGNDW